MKSLGKLAVLAAVIAMSASLTTTAHATTITGEAWTGWSSSVPLASGLPSSATEAATFTATSVDFCVDNSPSETSLCNPETTNYTLGGFLVTDASVSGVSGISYFNGATAATGLDNTLWEFTGSAYFTNGQTYTVAHDDGVILYVGGTASGNIVLNASGPTAPETQTYTYTGATGMQSFEFLYGEVDGAPAVFQTTLASGPNLVPEPNSLMLLGTGLIGAAGMLMRRRRLTA